MNTVPTAASTPATRAEVLANMPDNDGLLTILDRALLTSGRCNGGLSATIERHDTRNADGTVEPAEYFVSFEPIKRGGHEADIAADRIPELMLKLAQLHWSYKKMEALDRLFDGKNVPAAEDVIIESKRSGVPAGELFDSLISRVRP